MRLWFASWSLLLGLALAVHAQDATRPNSEQSLTTSDVEVFHDDEGRVTGGIITNIKVETKPSRQTQDLAINARITDVLKFHAPQVVTLGFTAKPCLSERNDYLILWVDGERYDAGVLESQFCAGGLSSLREFRTVEIPYSVFVQLAHAKQAKISIGEEQFSLSQEHLAAFRALINKVVEKPS